MILGMSVETILTSVTGYLFPINGVTPAHVVGAISLVILAMALYAVYRKRLLGPWRKIYVATAIAALFAYLNKLAPAGSEPPFAVVQGIVLILFIILGIATVRRYRPVD